jgi:hypothetical protein
MLFPGRYLVKIVGADGLIRTAYEEHHLTLLPTAYVLKKGMRSKVVSVSYIDLCTGRPVTNQELEAM